MMCNADKLASVGFDPVYGARPFKTGYSAAYLENPLAQDILTRKVLCLEILLRARLSSDGERIESGR